MQVLTTAPPSVPHRSDSPFGYLSRETDLEAASVTDGFMRTGRVVSVDDAQMGWSRSADGL